MLISGIPNERVTSPSNSKLTLRNGQVALGKVNKIYPNNRAEVQIGGHRFIAQIETPLVVGDRYIFQVDQKSEQLVHLRVIGHQVGEMIEENIASLLRQLNIRINDVSLQFVRALIDEEVPFNQRELVEALHLLERAGSTQKVQTMIKQMLMDKMPLQENYLRALLAVSNGQMSTSMANSLQSLQSMQQTPQITQLQSLLSSLIHSPTVENMGFLARTDLQSMIQTLQLFQYVSPMNHGEKLYRLVSNEETGQQTLTSLLNSLQEQGRKEHVRSSMGQLIGQYKGLHREATNIIREFDLVRTTALSEKQFTQLANRITNHILPLLPRGEQEVIRTLLNSNDSQSIRQIHALLQSFSTNQFYSILAEAIVQNDSESVLRTGTDFIQQRFVLHAEQLLQTLGLNHEAIAKQLPTQQEVLPQQMLNINDSIKSLLLNLVQDERAPLENIQQLVHHINGLQLQTREENNLLQAQLQLPGEKIGLPEDLFIKFEGRKTKDDEIDTEFCRILFFLHLHHIEDTIIDMNIQKRVVSLTVYNEYGSVLENQVHPFKRLLADGLNQLNYRLSNVRFKPLEDKVSIKEYIQEPTQQSATTSKEGFDLRI